MPLSYNDSNPSDEHVLSDECDSDDDPRSELSPSTLSILSLPELREALRKTQLDNQNLTQKYKALKLRCSQLESTIKSTRTKKGRKSDLSGEDREITHAGGRFALIGELWVDAAILKFDRPMSVDPLNPARYESPREGEFAILAEVYESLPEHLQQALSDKKRQASFITTFHASLNQERANTIATARRIAGTILDLDGKYFDSRYDRTTVLELNELLHDPGKPGERYPLWPPLLFPLGDCRSKFPFQVEALPKLLKGILFGISAIHGETTGRRPGRSSLWGVTKTTPGMIAGAATVLTFVCGPDTTFNGNGRCQSGVNWKNRFSLYKRAILHFPSAYRSCLLSWYDQRVFDTVPTSALVDASGIDNGLSAVNDLIHRMHDTTFSPTDPGPSPVISAPPLPPPEPSPSMPAAVVSTEPTDGVANESIADAGVQKKRVGATARARRKRGTKSVCLAPSSRRTTQLDMQRRYSASTGGKFTAGWFLVLSLIFKFFLPAYPSRTPRCAPFSSFGCSGESSLIGLHSRLALRTDLPGQTRSRGYWLSDRRLGHISRSSDKPVDTGYTLGCRIRVHTALATPPFQLEVSGLCLGPSESMRGSPGELHIPRVDSSAEWARRNPRLSNDEATLPTAQRKQRAAVVYLTMATSPETGMRYLEIYFLHLTTTRHFPSLIGSEARSNAYVLSRLAVTSIYIHPTRAVVYLTAAMPLCWHRGSAWLPHRALHRLVTPLVSGPSMATNMATTPTLRRNRRNMDSQNKIPDAAERAFEYTRR
ncbi:hypothetical protein BGW80DRAFT_1464759 [Lactifluus volemus]|nr:hypothetical protein BGW80DRAFT_1464759 [Lactifluus volemus]